jgi:hypothetical protein
MNFDEGPRRMPPTPPRKPTKQLSVRVGWDVADWLQHRAKADQRSLAFIVMELVRTEMAREAKRTKTKS